MQNNLLTINQFAKLCRSTPRTLRLYEQLGLLRPIERDKWNKYRLYDPAQGRLFFRIKLLQSFHVPLKNIQEMLNEKNKGEFLDAQINTLKVEISEKEKEYKFLKHMKQFFFHEKDLSKIVKKEIVGPYFTLSKDVVEEHYHQLNPDFIELSKLVDNLVIPRTTKTLVQYLEPVKYKPLSTHIEIAVVTKGKKIKNTDLPEGYFSKIFPKTTAYVYTYKGPYEFITLVYEKLHELRITEVLPVIFKPLDVQMDDFLLPHSPYDLVTKICFPIKS